MSTNIRATDRRITRSKSTMKDALITLMQSMDFKEISITSIVQLAELNRGTFYKHYQYKEELLEEIIDDVIKDLIISYRDPYQDKDTFIVKDLTSSAIKIFDHVNKHSSFYRLVINSSSLSGLQSRICNVLKNLASEDFLLTHINPNINKELLLGYQVHAIFGMIIEWVNSDFKYSSSYMAEQLIEFIHASPTPPVIKTNLKPIKHIN